MNHYNILIYCILFFNTISKSVAQDTISNAKKLKTMQFGLNVSFDRTGVHNFEPSEDFGNINNFGIILSKNVFSNYLIKFNPTYVRKKTNLFTDYYGDTDEYPYTSDNLRIPISICLHTRSIYFELGSYLDFLFGVRSGSNKEINFDEYTINKFVVGILGAVGIEKQIYKSLNIFTDFRVNQDLSVAIYQFDKKSNPGRFVNYGFNVGLHINLSK